MFLNKRPTLGHWHENSALGAPLRDGRAKRVGLAWSSRGDSTETRTPGYLGDPRERP